MSGSKLWRRYCDALYFHPELELYLDLSRMGFSPNLFEQDGLLQPALAAMRSLEAGGIANPDESRQVGHYWLRAPDLAPDPEIRVAIQQDIQQVEAFAAAVHDGAIVATDGLRFTDILCIGIGGSALGPQLITDALGRVPLPLGIHFMDNTDPAGIARLLGQLGERLASTLVVVTSKSGSTPETRNGMRLTQACFNEGGLSFPRHGVAITGQGSALDTLARDEGWLARFGMYDWIGGRTSVLSAVGLLPAALQGVDIRGLLAGAARMDEATRGTNVAGNPAALMALAWHQAGQGRGAKDMVVLPYKDQLQLMGRYLQQLIMESLGKERDLDGNVVHQGIAVYGNKGSTDQHAYVQQLRDGLANFFVTFIEVLEDGCEEVAEVEPGFTAGDYLFGFLEGTRQALFDNGRPSLTLTIPRVDAPSVGALIALFERSVGLYASLINVNAYHQPGVEAGKQAAAAFLDLQRQVMALLAQQPSPMTVEQLAKRLDRDDVEAVYKVLRHLQATGRGISMIGDRAAPDNLQVRFAKA